MAAPLKTGRQRISFTFCVGLGHSSGITGLKPWLWCRLEMGFDSLMPLWPALCGEQLLCGLGSVLCLCCTKKSQTSFRQTKLERLFSPRLFAAEMLFHKALSFGHRQVQWPSSMLLPRPHPPQEGCFEMDLGILMGPF